MPLLNRGPILVLCGMTAVMILGQALAAGPRSLTLARGGTVKHIASLRQSAASTTTSTTFVDIPQATYTFTLEEPEVWVVFARFSAESACSGGTPGASSWCSVQILLNGVPMEPNVGTDFAFDSTNKGAETSGSFEGHTVERSARCVRAGDYVLTAQWAVKGGASPPTFRVDDWSLFFEAADDDNC
jgi:hypothetical protein